MDITQEDQQLIELASSIIKEKYIPEKHRVCTVLQLKDGSLVKGINMEGSFGCIDICAEQITLGKALLKEQQKLLE